MANLTLYADENFTQPVTAEIGNYASVNWTTGTTYQKTIGEGEEAVTFKYAQGYITSQTIAFIQNPKPFVQYKSAVPGTETEPGSPAIIPSMDAKNFYIKPNMRVQITMKIVNGNTLSYGCKYFIGNVELNECAWSENITPLQDRAIYFSKIRRDGVESIIVYARDGNTTLHGGYVSENFWDGSFNIHTASKNKNVTPGGYGGSRGLQNNDRVPESMFSGINIINLSQSTAGIHVYELTLNQCDAFQNKLWDKITSFWTSQLKGCNPIQGILSFHYLPVSPPSRYDEHVTGVRVAGGTLDLGSGINLVTAQMFDIGGDNWTLDLNADEDFTQSFLDYAPYIIATLELPFIGQVPMDINKIMDGKLSVRYIFDVLTGNCMAEVYIQDRTGNKCLYGRYGGNASYQIPLTGDVNGGHALPSIFAGAATAGMGLATSNPIAVLSGVSSALQGNQAEMGQVGTLSTNIGCLAGDLRVRLHLTIKDDLTIMEGSKDKLQEILGLPSGCYGHVSDFTDNYVQGEIYVDQLTSATDAEKEAIKAIFESGVYVGGA